MILDKKSSFKNLYMVVMDNSGQVLWQKEVNPSFSGPDFSIEDFQVDNQGNVYMPAYSLVAKGARSNSEFFHLIQVTAEDMSMNTEPVSYGFIHSLKAKVLKTGEVMVAGYYADNAKSTSNDNGFLFYRFNPTTSTYSMNKNVDFGPGYKEHYALAVSTNKLGNQQYYITCEYLFELDNGNVVLCGEQKYIKQIQNYNGQTIGWIFLTGDILTSTITPDGTSQFQLITKCQAANMMHCPGDFHDAFVSYTAFQHQNEVSFLYNEDKDNVPYPGKRQVCTFRLPLMGKGFRGVATTLSENGEISQKTLLSSENTGQLLNRLLFSDSKAYYFTSSAKKSMFVNKFDFE